MMRRRLLLVVTLLLTLVGGLRVVVAGVGATETEVSMEAAFQGRCGTGMREYALQLAQLSCRDELN